MTNPVDDPKYWKQRIEDVEREKQDFYRTVFKCTKEAWEQYEQLHREAIKLHVGETDSVFDVGCGYGRLLTLMPPRWRGDYLGIDLSPDFIAAANRNFPRRAFITGDIRNMHNWDEGKFDWCICVSVKNMVVGNLGQAEWDKMEAAIRVHADRILLLEYGDSGVVI